MLVQDQIFALIIRGKNYCKMSDELCEFISYIVSHKVTYYFSFERFEVTSTQFNKLMAASRHCEWIGIMYNTISDDGHISLDSLAYWNLNTISIFWYHDWMKEEHWKDLIDSLITSNMICHISYFELDNRKRDEYMDLLKSHGYEEESKMPEFYKKLYIRLENSWHYHTNMIG